MIAPLASQALPVIVVAAALDAGSQARRRSLSPYHWLQRRSHRNSCSRSVRHPAGDQHHCGRLGGVVAGLIARPGLDPAGSSVYRIIRDHGAVDGGRDAHVTRSDDRLRIAADRRIRRFMSLPRSARPRRSRTCWGSVHRLFAKLHPRAADLDRRRTADPVPQPVRQRKFLDLTASTPCPDSLGTIAAILYQPPLAWRSARSRRS